MLSQCYIKQSSVTYPSIPTDYMKFSSEDVEKNGRVVRGSVVKKYDFVAVNKQFKYTDFCLDNLRAIDSPLVGRPVAMTSVNVDSIVSSFKKLGNENQSVSQEK